MNTIPVRTPFVKFDSADRKALRRLRNSFFGCSPEFLFDTTAQESQAVDAVCRGLIPMDVAERISRGDRTEAPR